MAIGITILVIAILIAIIWIYVELKRARHKIFAILLIFLILFSYLGFMASIKGKDIDFKSADGLKTAGKFYLSWLGNVFGNLKTITTNAIRMDWKAENSTGVG